MEEKKKAIIIDDSCTDFMKIAINLQIIMWTENIKNILVDFLYIAWKGRKEINDEKIKELENEINSRIKNVNKTIKYNEGYSTEVKIIKIELDEEKYIENDLECTKKVLNMIGECKSKCEDHYAIILDLILNEREDVPKFFNTDSPSEEILSEKIMKEESLCGKVIPYTCWDIGNYKIRSEWCKQQSIRLEDLLNKRQLTSVIINKTYKDKLIKILKGSISNE